MILLSFRLIILVRIVNSRIAESCYQKEDYGHDNKGEVNNFSGGSHFDEKTDGVHSIGKSKEKEQCDDGEANYLRR